MIMNVEFSTFRHLRPSTFMGPLQVSSGRWACATGKLFSRSLELWFLKGKHPQMAHEYPTIQVSEI